MPGLYRARSQAGLVWLVYPRWFGLREALSGAVGTLRSSAVLLGNSFESTATTANGIRFPFSGSLRAIKNDCTIILGAALDSATDYGALWGVPAGSGTWNDPYYALSLLKNSNLSSMRFHHATGATGFDGQNSSDNSELVYDGTYHVYAVTRSGAALKFYVDGVARGTATLASNSVTVFTNETEVVLLERSTTSAGEGTDGRLQFAAVYNRALSAGEMAALSEAPAAALLRRVNVSASVPVDAQPTPRKPPSGIRRPRPVSDANLQSLVFPLHFGWQEAISNRMPTARKTSAGLVAGALADAGALGAAQVVYQPPTARLIEREFTLLWYGRIDSIDTDAILMYLPGAGYEGISFVGGSASTQASLNIEGAGGYQYHSSGTGYLTTGAALQLYAVSVTASGVVTWYKNGAATAAGNITPTTPAPAVSYQISQGVTGLTLMSAVYNRALSAVEIARIAADPNILVRPALMGSINVYPPPTVDFTLSTVSGAAPLTVTAVANVSSAGYWNGFWSTDDPFGDTAFISQTAPASYTYTHVFDRPGTYNVSLIVGNLFGSAQTTKQVTVVAATLAPIAQIDAEPRTGTVPLTVQFRDVSNGGAVSVREWDLNGDGTFETTFQNPQFTYTAGGTYTARLRVSNAYGASEATAVIVVAAAPAAPPPPIVMTPDAVTYQVELDFGRDGTFTHPLAGITSRVLRASWGMGMSEAMQEFAPPSRMNLALSNGDGAWSPDALGATYRGLLVPGVLIRLRATRAGVTRTLWTGKVAQIAAAPGRYSNQTGSWLEVVVSAEDPMQALLDAEFVPTLLLEQRTDEAMRAMFDAAVFAWPYDKNWFALDVNALDSDAALWDASSMLALEPGHTVLPWAGDNLDDGRGVSGQTFLRDVGAAEGGGRVFWNGRTGTFDFHNRYHDAPGAVTAVLSELHVSGAVAAFGKDLANVVTVQYEPRAVGAPGTLLWEIDEPFTLRPGQERTLTARYRDPNNKKAKISALVVLPMQPGDVVANIEVQTKTRGSTAAVLLGADVSSQVSVTVEGKASSAKITVVNPLSQKVRVGTLRLRGTPLTTFGRDEATVRDAESILAYDTRELLLPMHGIDDAEFAEGLASVALMRRKRPLNRWESAKLATGYSKLDPTSTFIQEQMLARTVGDRVRMTDEWSGHDAEYIIVGEQHRVDGASATHEVTWVLKPAEIERWFVLDESSVDGDDVLVL